MNDEEFRYEVYGTRPLRWTREKKLKPLFTTSGFDEAVCFSLDMLSRAPGEIFIILGPRFYYQYGPTKTDCDQRADRRR